MKLDDPHSLSPLQHKVRNVLGSPPLNTSSNSRSFSHIPVNTPPPLTTLPSTVGPAVVWFRGHDLRVHDHAALDAATASSAPVVAIYVLERGAETDGAVSYIQRLSATSSQSNMHPDNISLLSTSSAESATTQSHHNKPYHTATSPATDDNDQLHQAWGPLSPNGGFALGRVQRWYLHHSLRVLRDQLQKLSITLVLRKVDCADDTAVEVLSVVRSLGATSVFWNKRYKPRAYPVDEAVKSGLREMNVVAQDYDSETLISPSTDYGSFPDFQSYARFWFNHMRLSPPSRPKLPIEPQNVLSLPRHVVHTLLSSPLLPPPSHDCSTHHRLLSSVLPDVGDLELLNGIRVSGDDSPGHVSSIGCVAATRALARFLNSDRFSRFASDKARRDGMATGEELATSRLSPHVRFGEISPRVLFWSVVDKGSCAYSHQDFQGLNAARLFVKNMSLREFGYYMLSKYPSAACKPIMPEFEVFPWEDDTDGALTRAWKNGTTGFPIVDAAMRQLIREGWLHNRMRFLCASFFCKYLLLPWPVGAAHMVRALVDGDEACNSLGWQWTAGCNSDSFPFSTLVNPLSLHIHTQSRARAAQYVRKYVPELSGLPDHLVFTPWTASDQERATFGLSLVPLRQYNEIRSNLAFQNETCGGQSILYPTRVVTGCEARYRARTAMEVMRRIFSSKKRVHPMLTAHTYHWSGDVAVNNNEKGKHDPCVAIVEIDESDDLPKASSVSELSNITLSHTSNMSREQTLVRKREEPDARFCEKPSKRPRTMLMSGRNEVGEGACHYEEHISKDSPPSRAPETSGAQRAKGGALSGGSESNIGSYTQAMSSCHKLADEDHMTGRRAKRASTPPRVKRPRSPLHQPARPTRTARISSSHESATPTVPDDRLSVKSLLSPNLSSPPSGLMRAAKPRDARHDAAEMMSAMSGLPKLAQAAAIQLDAQLSQQAHGRANEPARKLFPPTPRRDGGDTRQDGIGRNVFRPYMPPEGCGSLMHTASHSQACEHIVREVGENERRRPVTEVGSSATVHHRSARQHVLPSNSSADGSRMSNGMGVPRSHPPLGTAQHARAMGAQNEVRRARTLHRAGAAPAAMYHPNTIPMTVMGAPFTSGQSHGPPMLMPFAHAAGHLPMQALPHHSGATGAQSTQGYVGMNAIGAGHHHGAGSPFAWYPAMAPYMDMRPSAIPAMLPQIAHPFMHSGHNTLPAPYHVHGNNVAARSAAAPVAVGSSFGNKALTGLQRRGPATPVEREGIARRMAAMDYTDETYGGKHWEQWQAIALHLLNQYEFSDDTDRDTTRAYVRLCVLKDELRDANPSGPRVTVNHCKEVFRILNLPVTGEWDRRGHGGVRGPYVYGCIKRNSQQVCRH
ncbi:unnamed protein product [Agarophyton chilense]